MPNLEDQEVQDEVSDLIRDEINPGPAAQRIAFLASGTNTTFTPDNANATEASPSITAALRRLNDMFDATGFTELTFMILLTAEAEQTRLGLQLSTDGGTNWAYFDTGSATTTDADLDMTADAGTSAPLLISVRETLHVSFRGPVLSRVVFTDTHTTTPTAVGICKCGIILHRDSN